MAGRLEAIAGRLEDRWPSLVGWRIAGRLEAMAGKGWRPSLV